MKEHEHGVAACLVLGRTARFWTVMSIYRRSVLVLFEIASVLYFLSCCIMNNKWLWPTKRMSNNINKLFSFNLARRKDFWFNKIFKRMRQINVVNFSGQLNVTKLALWPELLSHYMYAESQKIRIHWWPVRYPYNEAHCLKEKLICSRAV